MKPEQEEKPVTETLEINGSPGIIDPNAIGNSYQLSPSFMAMYFTYYNLVNFVRMQGLSNMMQ